MGFFRQSSEAVSDSPDAQAGRLSPGMLYTMNPRWWLAAIVCLGLALRVWGVAWGLPGRMDMHPDEHDYVLRFALKLSAAQPDPGFLNYPSFLLYLIAVTFRGLTHLGAISGADWQAFLIGRLWSVLFATATIFPVFKLTRELGGSIRAALLAALWMALLPLHVWESHVAVTDPLMTFWIAMTFWASVRLARTSRLYDYLFAGVCLGLAMGSKYSAAIAVVAVIAGAAVALARTRSFTGTFAGLAVAGTMSILCAYFVTPFSFIRYEDLLTAMSLESQHTGSNHFGFSVPAHGWHYRRYLYQVVAAWPFSLGLALFASVAAGTCWAVWRCDRRALPLFAFAVLFFGIIGSWHFVPLRYALPLLVVGVVFAGLWQAALVESQNGRARAAGRVIILATFVYTLIFSGQTAARYSNETRVAATRWLDQNLRQGSTLALCGWTRYVAMPSNPAGCTIVGGRDDRLLANIRDGERPDLIEITSMHRERHVRHGNTNWISAYDRLCATNGDFECVARFESRFINKSFYAKLDPMFGGYFVSPTIEFYRPRRPATVATSSTTAGI